MASPLDRTGQIKEDPAAVHGGMGTAVCSVPFPFAGGL